MATSWVSFCAAIGATEPAIECRARACAAEHVAAGRLRTRAQFERALAQAAAADSHRDNSVVRSARAGSLARRARSRRRAGCNAYVSSGVRRRCLHAVQRLRSGVEIAFLAISFGRTQPIMVALAGMRVGEIEKCAALRRRCRPAGTAVRRRRRLPPWSRSRWLPISTQPVNSAHCSQRKTGRQIDTRRNRRGDAFIGASRTGTVPMIPDSPTCPRRRRGLCWAMQANGDGR